MAAVRHLDLEPDLADAPLQTRHLALVAPRPAPTTVAAYRRRRLVVGVVVAVLLVAALHVSAPVAAPPSAASPRTGGGVHVVQPGDTYWSIASALATSGPLLETVDALVASNGGRLLQPGDRLVLPR